MHRSGFSRDSSRRTGRRPGGQLLSFNGTGVDATGGPAAATFAGVQVGDVVVSILMSDPGLSNVAGDFEGVVTVAGQIQQQSTDLDGVALVALVTRNVA